jgi:hypothetical protein
MQPKYASRKYSYVSRIYLLVSEFFRWHSVGCITIIGHIWDQIQYSIKMLTVFSRSCLCYKNNRDNVSLFSCVTNVNGQISSAVSNVHVLSICVHSCFIIVTHDNPRRRYVSNSRFLHTDLSNIARYCHSWRHLITFDL